MSVKIAGSDIKNVLVGGVQAKTIRMGTGSGNVEVWSAKPTERITLDSSTGAQTAFRNALTRYGTTYQTVKEIPFNIELVGSGSMRLMFDSCAALTTIPQMNTANVTSMYATFAGCTALTSVPPMDTSNVTEMRSLFNGCQSLTTVPQMNTAKVTTMYQMYGACNSLTSVPPMDTSNVTDMTSMFYGCFVLPTVPQMNTTKVTTMHAMFDGCAELTFVPDMSTANVTNIIMMFQDCKALKDGKVRLIGKNSSVITDTAIRRSGLTRVPFYDASGNPI